MVGFGRITPERISSMDGVIYFNMETDVMLTNIYRKTKPFALSDVVLEYDVLYKGEIGR